MKDERLGIGDWGLGIDPLALVPNQLLAGWKARPTLSLFARWTRGLRGEHDAFEEGLDDGIAGVSHLIGRAGRDDLAVVEHGDLLRN